MDHSANAKRYRHQAEELRTKSELMIDSGTRDQYAKMAAAYEMLADNEEKLVLKK